MPAKLEKVSVIANAKVNLALDIIGTREGMHLIDTLIVPIGLADKVEVSPSEEFEVVYTDGRVYPSDTALKAAKLIAATYGIPPVRIGIEKKIPEGKGLGGSSADAAGVARAMQELFGLPEIPAGTLVKIGSDVPAMYKNAPVRVRGAGEVVTPYTAGTLYLLLLTADIEVSTREAYVLYDQIGGEQVGIDDVIAGKARPANALERAAITLAPRVGELKAALIGTGITDVVMTGSGSGMIGFTRDRTVYLESKEKLDWQSLSFSGAEAMGFEIHSPEQICRKTN